MTTRRTPGVRYLGYLGTSQRQSATGCTAWVLGPSAEFGSGAVFDAQGRARNVSAACPGGREPFRVSAGYDPPPLQMIEVIARPSIRQ